MRHQTRRARLLRQRLVPAGVWVFLVFFVLSVVGVAIIIVH
jgi:hypothetical protein